MKFTVFFLLAVTQVSIAAKAPLTPCDEILKQIARVEDGKVRGYGPMLKVEVKSDVKLEDLEPELRTQIVQSADSRLPLGFQVLMLRILKRHSDSLGSGEFWSMPKIWQTPPHWYELTPEVYPEGHRQMSDPGSFTQVISPLDRELWEVVRKSSDVVAGAWADTTANQFSTALNKQERKKTKNESFWLELADADSNVLLKVKVQGIGAGLFDEKLSKHEGEVLDPWATWDSSGGTGEDGSYTTTLTSLDASVSAANVGAWLDWIKSKFRKVQFDLK